MGRHISLVLALLLTLIVSVVHAHDKGNAPEDYVHAHSCIRKALNLPPMTWDPELAKVAQAYAEQRKDCQLIHSGRCGENLAYGWNLSGAWAVQLWLDERPDYDQTTNECIKMCGHYTQMVWKDSVRLGCGRIVCNDPAQNFVVCNYEPCGNWQGQRPF